uniref:Coiled-coil domain-containing protein n=1 Tax=Gasterosteus aculeatus aculeatus TaxID=481459 RepID=A0AAQ4QTK2_GASAC|nr:coiled-coil domain-containing protein 187 isoform X2 [Gasterosteus aculeatus aculeatus]XP_040049645.1 coiled-coil domain-containing protein 187 isoform X2 [Gasterosteus aculeatus aculeatus]XP_040049646.1 coiled-coil domain-containing protein 187 isoform X2 [Gasterosteus aculeatus aculeatus]
MAEVEIDQSNLPRVQEVRQCFAVLEDGALAHNLQEQEIEQYYTTNIHKNQLVQNDIRVAKRLQDEEEEEQAQQSTLHRQSSRRLEMEDFEYARVVQEEIQRCAEEARRREQEDKEIAKQMQEEEKERITRISRGWDGLNEGRTIDPAPPSPRQHTLTGLHHGGAQYSSTTTRWQYSTSHSHSDFTRPPAYSPRGVDAQKNTTPWSNQGHTDSIRENTSELRERLSEDSEDSDTVFSERLIERLDTAPPRRRASLYQPPERNYRSLYSRRSYTEEERGERTENYNESGDLERRNRRNLDAQSEENRGLHSGREQARDCRSVEVRERRSSRSKSVRLHDRRKPSNGDLARTWSCTENPDKHVRFQDDTRRSPRPQGDALHVWEMLGQVLRERGVPVRFGCKGAPLQIRPAGRDSLVLHGSEVSCSDSRPHQGAFRRAAATRHSFHGDIREGKRYPESSGRDHRDWQSKDRNLNEISGRDSNHPARGERGGSRRWKDHRRTEGDGSERNANHCRVERTTSQRRRFRPEAVEERLSSEEEGREAGRGGERPLPRAPQRTRSLGSSRASSGGRWRRAAAGAPVQAEAGGASLDLRELRQVLQDEELAHKLQEEEERLLRRNSRTSPCVYPEGDFRVAQVAQDEEIAHFMQKQEMKSKRRSRELEGPESWREHRGMISGRAARDRPVHRERLDSEGLPSPTEDGSPENQPPSPFATIPESQQFRNIAEELDPTFQGERPSTEGFGGGAEGTTCQSLPMPQTGLNDLLEEATFIPPTKRKTDKSGRVKSKKKDNCKHQ